MRGKALLDTGPLVAFLNRRDRHHAWTTERLGEIEAPLLTCEAVLSEACFLLRQVPGGSEAVMNLIERGLLLLPFRLEDEAPAVRRLLARFASVPMSLADACLVRMTEQHPESVVMTLDRDFLLYRKHGRQVVPTLLPAGRG